MATSPLFGWSEPDDTDLVKDGAAAIRTLGNAIDTSLGDLLGGTTGQVLTKNSNTNMDFTWTAVDPLVILDAKGDLISATAADTPARLAVGTNGQVLTADSTASTGLAWSTITTGGITLLSTTNLTVGATSTTISSISQDYSHLIVLVTGVYTSTIDGDVSLRFNSDTSTNYGRSNIRCLGSTVGGFAGTGSTEYSFIDRTPTSSASAGLGYGSATIYRYTSTDPRYIESTGRGTGASAVTQTTTGNYTGSSAISSITVVCVSGFNFDGGTVYIYGVK
jgi:hypothetical protein